MKNVVFIAHGGEKVGMGHIMRSLSLAKQFRIKNFNVTFISKYEAGIDIIKKNNFNVEIIFIKDIPKELGFFYGNNKELLQETIQIENYLKQNKTDILIIDSYNVSYEFFKTLKKYVKCLVYIDDINKFDYPVDVLINGNISGSYMNYKKENENEILLLGIKYNLIRDEFCNISKRKPKENIENIMITTGASDPYNMTFNILQFLINNIDIKDKLVHVIIGKGFNNSNITSISKFIKNYSNINLYNNPKKISNIMLKSDLAITAGGSTLYELCACGVPTLAFIYAENQRLTVERMEKEGYILNIGFYNNIDYNKFENKYNFIVNDYDRRYKMIMKMQSLVDCKGVERIVNIIENKF